jgi:hypothetical protein
VIDINNSPGKAEDRRINMDKAKKFVDEKSGGTSKKGSSSKSSSKKKGGGSGADKAKRAAKEVLK